MNTKNKIYYVIDFNKNSSVQKTVRKPDITLKEFENAGKVALRTFLQDLTTTDSKLNGRINNDIILLKVF